MQDLLEEVLHERSPGAPPGEHTIVGLLLCTAKCSRPEAAGAAVIASLRASGALEELPGWTVTSTDVIEYLISKLGVTGPGESAAAISPGTESRNMTGRVSSESANLPAGLLQDDERDALTQDGWGGADSPSSYSAELAADMQLDSASGHGGTADVWNPEDQAWGFRVRLTSAGHRDSLAEELRLRVPRLRKLLVGASPTRGATGRASPSPRVHSTESS